MNKRRLFLCGATMESVSAAVIVVSSFLIPEFGLTINTKRAGRKVSHLFTVSTEECINIGSRLARYCLIKPVSKNATFRNDDTMCSLTKLEIDHDFIFQHLAKAVAMVISDTSDIDSSSLLCIKNLQLNSDPQVRLESIKRRLEPPAAPEKKEKKKKSKNTSEKVKKVQNQINLANTKMRVPGESGKSGFSFSASSMSLSSSFVSSSASEEGDDVKYMTDNDESDDQSFPLIKAGSIDRLIERLTHESFADIKFRVAFMLSYRSFLDPHELLHKIEQRFYEVTDEASKHSIQYKVVGTLKSWIENYPEDFLDDPTLKEKLNLLIEKISLVLSIPGKNLKDIVQKKLEESLSTQKKYPLPQPLIGEDGEPIMPSEFSFVDMDVAVLSKQISYLEFNLYANIHIKELMSLNWSKNKELAPNVLSFIGQFNRTSRWVQYNIVRHVKLTTRVEWLERFIKLTHRLFEMNNFNGVNEILSGINSAPVRRLKKTWEGVSSAGQTKLSYLEKIMSHDGNFATYREFLHVCDPPTVPYLGTYLTDLTFIEEGNQGKDGDLINMDKHYKVAAVIGELSRYQIQGYDVVPDEEIQLWLTHLKSVSEEEAYNLSLKVEPRKPDEAIEILLSNEEKLRNEIKLLQLRNADLEHSNEELKKKLEGATREINVLRRNRNGPKGPVRGGPGGRGNNGRGRGRKLQSSVPGQSVRVRNPQHSPIKNQRSCPPDRPVKRPLTASSPSAILVPPTNNENSDTDTNTDASPPPVVNSSDTKSIPIEQRPIPPSPDKKPTSTEQRPTPGDRPTPPDTKPTPQQKPDPPSPDTKPVPPPSDTRPISTVSGPKPTPLEQRPVPPSPVKNQVVNLVLPVEVTPTELGTPIMSDERDYVNSEVNHGEGEEIETGIGEIQKTEEQEKIQGEPLPKPEILPRPTELSQKASGEKRPPVVPPRKTPSRSRSKTSK